MTVLQFRCPRCDYAMNDATCLTRGGEEIKPKPGDVGLCIHCAAPVEYAKDLAPRWLTHDEVGQLPRDVRMHIVQAMVAIVTQRPSRIRAVRPDV